MIFLSNQCSFHVKWFYDRVPETKILKIIITLLLHPHSSQLISDHWFFPESKCCKITRNNRILPIICMWRADFEIFRMKFFHSKFTRTKTTHSLKNKSIIYATWVENMKRKKPTSWKNFEIRSLTILLIYNIHFLIVKLEFYVWQGNEKSKTGKKWYFRVFIFQKFISKYF